MNGNEVFDDEYKHRAQVVLDKNKDKPYMVGFKNYISDRSYSTIWGYVSRVCAFMNNIGKEAKDLTLDDFTNHMANIKDKTASHQVVEYTALKNFSEYLSTVHIIPEDYMTHIKKPKLKEGIKTKEKREIGFLDKDEIKEFINQVYQGIGSHKAKSFQKHFMWRDAAIMLMFLNTGMRSNALWKLDVSNIDFENKKLITIDKGEKYQEYFLSDDLIDVLERWLSDREKILDGSNETALFISRYKTRITQVSLRVLVKKYSSNIKDKHITPHKLRATAITSVYKATGDVYLAQKFAGHSSPETTTLYIRGNNESKARQTGADIMSQLTF